MSVNKEAPFPHTSPHSPAFTRSPHSSSSLRLSFATIDVDGSLLFKLHAEAWSTTTIISNMANDWYSLVLGSGLVHNHNVMGSFCVPYPLTAVSTLPVGSGPCANHNIPPNQPPAVLQSGWAIGRPCTLDRYAHTGAFCYSTTFIKLAFGRLHNYHYTSAKWSTTQLNYFSCRCYNA